MAFRFSAQIANWGITLVIIRILTPQDYGLFALAGFFIGLLTYLNEFGLGSALVRQQTLDESLVRSVAGFTVCVNAAVFLVLLFGAPFIAGYFDEPRIEMIVRVQSLQFLLMAFAMVPSSLLSRDMRFRAKGAVDFAAMIASAITTFTLALLGYGVWALVFGSLAASFAQAVGVNLAIGRLIVPSFSFRGIGQVIGFGATVTATRVLWYLYTSLDTLIIGKVLGTYLVGIYDVARQLAAMPMIKVSGILNDVGYSAFSKVQDDPVLLAEHYLKAIRLIALFAFPVFLGMSVTSREIVAVVLGDNWLAVAMPLQCVALLIPFRMMNNISAPALMAINRPEISLIGTAIGLALMPLATWIGTHWGLDGVIVCWSIAYIILWLIIQRISLPVLRIQYSELWAVIRDPLFASSVMFLAVELIRMSLLDTNSVIVLPTLVMSGAIIYGAVMYSINKALLYEAIDVIRR
ncbi:MAG: teichuronic acid exporter [Gammaproteobacteria bacterium]|jgi:teichuronic acid exporter